MIDCLATTFKKDGIRRGLYAGTVPALVANISENAILFAAYGVCQKAVAFTTHQVRLLSSNYLFTSVNACDVCLTDEFKF